MPRCIKDYIKRCIPDRLFLKLMYRKCMGKKLNLKNPQTFNEKLQWLKLYNRKTEYTKMVDKYEAKKYVAEKIGEEYIIPTLGVWNSFDEIDFDALPCQFVLKCTHDSGGLVIVKDKSNFDKKEACKKITRCLKRNYFWQNREWPYKNVRPRIIAEKYMEDSVCHELTDYKFYCFNGKPEFILVATERASLDGVKMDFFDMDFNHLEMKWGHSNSKKTIVKPKSFDKIINFAEKLSKVIPLCRCDFYEVNGKPYFGEITFFPASGMEAFEPEGWDKILGDWIKLPVRPIK